MKYYLFLILIGTIYDSVQANDTTATIAAGAIEYTKSSDICMDLEVLKISTDHVEVAYRFTNHSQNEITSQVIFPLPRSPVFFDNRLLIFPEWDDLFRAYHLIDDAKEAAKLPFSNISNTTLSWGTQHAAFTNFKRTVNGSEYGYNFVARAIHQDGRDITSLLIQNNIPLSAIYVSGFEEAGLIHKDPNVRQKLQKLGLADDKDKILWQLQISYIWQQRFAPQKTVHVTHSYRPYVGNHFLSGKASSTLDKIKFHHRDTTIDHQLEIKELKNYCPSKSDILAIEDMFAFDKMSKHVSSLNDDMSYKVKEVRYILSTGANWKGSIRKFRLEIIPPFPSTRVMTCFSAPLQKNEQGIYVVELDNFIPTSDLKILFIDTKFETINVRTQ